MGVFTKVCINAPWINACLNACTVQLDLNFKNTHVCNSTRTTQAAKSSLYASKLDADDVSITSSLCLT